MRLMRGSSSSVSSKQEIGAKKMIALISSKNGGQAARWEGMESSRPLHPMIRTRLTDVRLPPTSYMSHSLPISLPDQNKTDREKLELEAAIMWHKISFNLFQL